MAYKREWIDNELVIEHKGVKIYRLYNEDNHDDPFSWHFGLTAQETEDGPTCFDIRELPNAGSGQLKQGSYGAEEAAILEVLEEAIDLGYIQVAKSVE